MCQKNLHVSKAVVSVRHWPCHVQIKGVTNGYSQGETLRCIGAEYTASDKAVVEWGNGNGGALVA